MVIVPARPECIHRLVRQSKGWMPYIKPLMKHTESLNGRMEYRSTPRILIGSRAHFLASHLRRDKAVDLCLLASVVIRPEGGLHPAQDLRNRWFPSKVAGFVGEPIPKTPAARKRRSPVGFLFFPRSPFASRFASFGSNPMDQALGGNRLPFSSQSVVSGSQFVHGLENPFL